MPEVPAIAETVPASCSAVGSECGPGRDAGAGIGRLRRDPGGDAVPAMKERVAGLGYEAAGSTPEEFAEFQAREIARTANW